MAKGRMCPCCDQSMQVLEEERKPAGTLVTYVCRSSECGRCKKDTGSGECQMNEKVLES